VKKEIWRMLKLQNWTPAAEKNAMMRLIITFNPSEYTLAPFLATMYLCSGRRGESIWPFPLWVWDKRKAAMARRRQHEQQRGSLMVVINDNGPEESWDTGATYIIPSHQSMHLCGLLSANQHTTARKKNKKTKKNTLPHLHAVSSPPRRFLYDSLWAS